MQVKWHRAPGTRVIKRTKLGNLPFPWDRQKWRGQRKQELSCPWVPHKLCRSVHLHHPGSIQASVDLETVVVTVGSDSRAGELADASGVVPPGVTLCLGQSGAAREQRPHRVNSSHGAWHLAGGGTAPRGAHT